MRIIVEMGHPGHVHHFKNMIWELEKKGHKVKICTADKEVALNLLDAYGFKYEVLGKNHGSGFIKKIPLLIKFELKMLNIATKFKPDLFVCRGSPISAHVSKILSKKSISFNDTEHTKVIDKYTFPLLDRIITPSCFKLSLGAKQIRYNGYTELAYLHPEYFKPNPKILEELGFCENDTFIVLRFVSWNAHHDVGQHGIRDKIEFVKKLEKYGRVLITSEGQLSPELEKYKIRISPEKLHDLLYYATLYIGEGATTASECAVLGTHAIYVNTLRLGYTDEEEYRYGLVYNFSDPNTMEKDAFNKAVELLEKPDLISEGKKKRERLLEDKIDVTAFMVKCIEQYQD